MNISPPSPRALAVISVVAIIGLLLVCGQAAGWSTQDEANSITATNIQSILSFSDMELAKMMEVLAAQPTVALEDQPREGRVGTFFSLQHPEWPPLPGNLPSLPAWDLGDDNFLIDDLDWDYAGPKSLDGGGGMALLSGPEPPGGGGEGGGEDEGPGYEPIVYTTNDLWLEMTSWTNSTANLVINMQWDETNGIFDLFATTNLTTNVTGLNLTNWVWLLRTTSWQTNLTVTNDWPEEGYFRLGTLLDSDSDGLTDAYENLVSHTNPNNPDTDGDGWSDSQEHENGTDPTQPADQPLRIRISRPNSGLLP